MVRVPDSAGTDAESQREPSSSEGVTSSVAPSAEGMDLNAESIDATLILRDPEPLDGRTKGEWRTRYSEVEARRQIRWEVTYLFVAILAALAAIIAVALRWPRPFLGISDARWSALAPYAYAWAGGGLGGALFSAKWLIHTVGRGTWNQDRLTWRLFTPWLGAGAGLLVVLLSISRVVPLFDSTLVSSGAGATGIAMLVGFFADRTFSRLEGFAASHFQPKRPSTKPDAD